MKLKRSCILSTGGTGGHLFPAIALAESLIDQGWQVLIITDVRGAVFIDGCSTKYQVKIISISSETISFFRKLLIYLYQIPIDLIKILYLMLKIKPKFVVGFGGVSTMPVLLATVLLRIPLFLQEQNAVLGRVNRFFQKFSKSVFYHFEKTKFLDEKKSIQTGNPARKIIIEKENTKYIPASQKSTVILVLGGSQGASFLSELIPLALLQCPKEMRAKIRIFHQARPKDLEAVTLSYKRIGIRADVQKFFEDIEEKISEAQLVISRAGATTLTDISVIGRPAIFIPLSSARDDHQCLNAKSFEDKGAAISLRENEVSPKILSSLIQKILRSPSKALRMAKNSYAMSASKASFKIISKIEEKIGK